MQELVEPSRELTYHTALIGNRALIATAIFKSYGILKFALLQDGLPSLQWTSRSKARG
jgi:hypothetical protein